MFAATQRTFAEYIPSWGTSSLVMSGDRQLYRSRLVSLVARGRPFDSMAIKVHSTPQYNPFLVLHELETRGKLAGKMTPQGFLWAYKMHQAVEALVTRVA